MKKALLFLAIISPCVFGKDFGQRMTLAGGTSAPTPASLIALLGNPEKWNSRLVSTSGFLRSDLHGAILFMSMEYCERGDSDYGILVDHETIEPEVSWRSLPAEECTYAQVEGNFLNTPHPEPEPNTFVYRWRPALMEANFIYVEDAR
jgi:hypothetical protein